MILVGPLLEEVVSAEGRQLGRGGLGLGEIVRVCGWS